MEDQSRVLKVVDYTIEIWDWHTGLYLADISNIVTDGLSMSWTLNDVETLDFSIDLIQFENKCKDMGVTVEELLTPYVHDVRIRRNGEYILGCQIVETNINISNNTPPTIQLKCTGFLNLFKDQYLSEPLSGYTYAQMAHKIVNRAQHADIIVRNPTIDIDASYWLSPTGTVATTTASKVAGQRSLQVTRSATGWVGGGTQLINCPAGTPIVVDCWVSCQSGVAINFRERALINISSDQVTIGSITPTGNNTWTHFIQTFTTTRANPYIYIEVNRTSTTYPLRIDNCFIYKTDDDDSLHALKVKCLYTGLDDTTTGTEAIDTASPYQTTNRQRSYSLQNVKDAIMDLTSLENDNFDFEFTPDRKFNTYYRKGSDKVDLEIVYPGNIHSMTIQRSAANLANKIQNIGSGIGDERIEAWATDRQSRLKYGTREKIVTNNNVVLVDTLTAQAEGLLYDLKEKTNLPKVVVRDGSINPSNLQTGDGILIKVDNGDDYLNTINGLYRVMQMEVQTDLENVEQVTLTVE